MKTKNILLAIFLPVLCVFPAHSQKNDNKEVVRILAIGNSFSEDALDTYFHDICEAAGKKVIVGNLYIPGCSIERHMLNARTDSAAYRFRRIGLDGDIIEAEPVRLSSALGSDNWNFISFQQASHISGKYNTFADLSPLIAYVQNIAPQDAKLAWHQTWAYSADSKHDGYKNYGRDQHIMYDSIMSANRRAIADNTALSIIIPSGTAIQTAREKSGNYDFTRDGYHLDPVIGRYIASCTWFETIFGESVVGNTFIPEGLTPEQTRFAQEAAHEANLHPLGK